MLGSAEKIHRRLRSGKFLNHAAPPHGGELLPQVLGLGITERGFNWHDRRYPARPAFEDDVFSLNCRIDELAETIPCLINRERSHLYYDSSCWSPGQSASNPDPGLGVRQICG